jgi:hypothetical protein
VLGLIQEYMEGGSLYDMLLLQQHPGLTPGAAYTPRQALTWLLQLARALAYLHSATPRIIHRWVGGCGARLAATCRLPKGQNKSPRVLAW